MLNTKSFQMLQTIKSIAWIDLLIIILYYSLVLLYD